MISCSIIGRFVAVAAILALTTATATAQIGLVPIGTYRTGIFDDSAAEIPAYDAANFQLFVTNAADGTVDVLDVADPHHPVKSFSIPAIGANSVAVFGSTVAIARENANKQLDGFVDFYDTAGNFLKTVTAGPLPDMLTFTPDGSKLLVANEGEPNDDYTVDPMGSISIIDLSSGVLNATEMKATFTHLDGTEAALRSQGVRIFGPNASASQDLEPEYIAVSPDGGTAFVTLQENNAVAIVDIANKTVTDVKALGFKDHNDPANQLDPSNKDGGNNIGNWPVLGMYQPDAIASYEVGGQTYYVTANEGDARDYDGFSEEVRVNDLTLDPTAYPNASDLQMNEQLGRLKTTTALGDTDGDNDVDQVYSYGARSFSIWDDSGNLVWDSGDDFETITAATIPTGFNANNDQAGNDSRSDDKGPEPEAVIVVDYQGMKLAFVANERVSTIMVYDITDPLAPQFIEMVDNRDFSVVFDEDGDGDPDPTAAQLLAAGDLGPEGLLFIPIADSPIDTPLLVVTNEVSGTTTIWAVPEPASIALLGVGGLALLRRGR